MRHVGRTILLVFQTILCFSLFAEEPGYGTDAGRFLADAGSAGKLLYTTQGGTPVMCGTMSKHVDSAMAGAPAGVRVWESIPGVIRNDGQDSFRIEVTTEASVSNVFLDVWAPLVAESGRAQLTFTDDGRGQDRVAGDSVFTSELLRFDVLQGWQHPSHFYRDTNSPTGISLHWAGQLTIQGLDGTTATFAHQPQVGVLSTDIPLVNAIPLSSDVAIAPHLINVRTQQRWTQQYLRFISSGLSGVAQSAFQALPDAFDFLVFFSSERLERLPFNASPNFNAGVHRSIRVDYSGTGQSPRNESALWGSNGRLMGVIALDSYQPGISGQNLVHEILHQWGSYTATSISDGSHYVPRSSVASLLGGYLWATNGDGSRQLICEQGREGATFASPIDKYMMGLIDDSSVPPMHVYAHSAPPPFSLCGQTVPTASSTVTIADIRGLYGPRVPGPSSAKRAFSLGFVVESNRRFLNSVEITFYEQLAAHCTRSVPANHPAPYIGQQTWPFIGRYFGENTSWRSDVLELVQPHFTAISPLGGGRLRLTAQGHPGTMYSLSVSSDLEQWTSVDAQPAASDGSLTFTTTASGSNRFAFYRLRL